MIIEWPKNIAFAYADGLFINIYWEGEWPLLWAIGLYLCWGNILGSQWIPLLARNGASELEVNSQLLN